MNGVIISSLPVAGTHAAFETPSLFYDDRTNWTDAEATLLRIGKAPRGCDDNGKEVRSISSTHAHAQRKPVEDAISFRGPEVYWVMIRTIEPFQVGDWHHVCPTALGLTRGPQQSKPASAHGKTAAVAKPTAATTKLVRRDPTGSNPCLGGPLT